MSINYKAKYIFVYILLSIVLSAYSSHPYVEKYIKECEYALDFYKSNKTRFKEIANKTSFNPDFLFAIVAPEITQFSHLSDKLETYSLKLFYVQGGKEYSNFSIGHFQMKPSFIEQMEESLKNDDNLIQKFEKCLIDNPDSREARVERINRLMQLEWQIEYLALFCELLNKKFPLEKDLPEESLLKIYATAYNAGFNKSQNDIEKISQKAQFPHFSTIKYKYYEIALWFYRNCSNS